MIAIRGATRGVRPHPPPRPRNALKLTRTTRRASEIPAISVTFFQHLRWTLEQPWAEAARPGHRHQPIVENVGLGSPANPGRLRYVAPSRPFLVSTGNPPGGTPRLYGRRGRLPLLERSRTRACRKSAVETPTRAANICLMKLVYAVAALRAHRTV